MTTEERREANRLRSERYRRARGIMPRKPAERPWLAEGCSRSAWYRRRAKARQQAALTATFDRAEFFVRQLQAELAEAAWYQATAAAIIDEFVGGRQ
jgi:hypothetical protein